MYFLKNCCFIIQNTESIHEKSRPQLKSLNQLFYQFGVASVLKRQSATGFAIGWMPSSYSQIYFHNYLFLNIEDLFSGDSVREIRLPCQI